MNGLTINKSRYRVILEIEAFDDFDPFEFNWEEALDLQSSESAHVVKVEDYDDYMF